MFSSQIDRELPQGCIFKKEGRREIKLIRTVQLVGQVGHRDRIQPVAGQISVIV
ncbi:hypothetical protein D3C87_1063690 [compost metagenome]